MPISIRIVLVFFMFVLMFVVPLFLISKNEERTYLLLKFDLFLCVVIIVAFIFTWREYVFLSYPKLITIAWLILAHIIVIFWYKDDNVVVALMQFVMICLICGFLQNKVMEKWYNFQEPVSMFEESSRLEPTLFKETNLPSIGYMENDGDTQLYSFFCKDKKNQWQSKKILSSDIVFVFLDAEFHSYVQETHIIQRFENLEKRDKIVQRDIYKYVMYVNSNELYELPN